MVSKQDWGCKIVFLFCPGVIKERFERLKLELDRIRRAKEGCILIGDLNKKIGADKLGVIGNKPSVSYGGHLVRALVESGDYFLANNTPEDV